MKPKEKAKKLCDYYYFFIHPTNDKNIKYICKECAIIAVDEILESHYTLFNGIKPDVNEYWKEVKREIHLL